MADLLGLARGTLSTGLSPFRAGILGSQRAPQRAPCQAHPTIRAPEFDDFSGPDQLSQQDRSNHSRGSVKIFHSNQHALSLLINDTIRSCRSSLRPQKKLPAKLSSSSDKILNRMGTAKAAKDFLPPAPPWQSGASLLKILGRLAKTKGAAAATPFPVQSINFRSVLGDTQIACLRSMPWWSSR